MRSTPRVLASLLALGVALVGVPLGPLAPAPVQAIGTIIVVNTTSDDEFPADGTCSLRAAIEAANVNGIAGWCDPGSGVDAIYFSIGSGTPVISVASALPSITDSLNIRGNSGGATRVEIRGPGSGTGLSIGGPGTSSTTIRNLVIDGFATGIDIHVPNVTLAGSIIGPNSDSGIMAFTSVVHIGGTAGTTQGGPCTGDCNLVSGNAKQGLYIAGGGVVEGNFIGTTAAGTASSANGSGITVSSGTWLLGGTSAAAANVVSGNAHGGIGLHSCTCTILGNFVGTNAAGTAAVPNGGPGVYAAGTGNETIGGPGAGERNVISGNTGHGIDLQDSVWATIQGNRVGTTKNGTKALGNGGDGIHVAATGPDDWSGSRSTLIGSASDTGAFNTIAFNGSAGVRVSGSTTNKIEIRGTSIHDNTGKGIAVAVGANAGVQAPVVQGTKPVYGTACPGCTVDVYSDTGDEGRTFEGSATANKFGQWNLGSSVPGPNVTATTTNLNHGTSAFSSPVAVPVPTAPPPTAPPPTAPPLASSSPTAAPTVSPSAESGPTPFVLASPVAAAPSDAPEASNPTPTPGATDAPPVAAPGPAGGDALDAQDPGPPPWAWIIALLMIAGAAMLVARWRRRRAT
jgi:CSLREA domain-containing protein